MSRSPYPGYPPSFKIVDKTGDYHRTCIVIEFLNHKQLDNMELALIQEKLEAYAQRLMQSIVTLESVKVVLPDQFDPLLLQGLRLS